MRASRTRKEGAGAVWKGRSGEIVIATSNATADAIRMP